VVTEFLREISTHASPLGMPPAQVITTTADCNMLIYLLQSYVNIIRHDASEAVKYKELIKNGPIGSPSAGLPALTGMPPGPARCSPRTPLKSANIGSATSMVTSHYKTGVGWKSSR
jgi:hypothetical protein